MPIITIEQIVADLRQLGVAPGDHVLMHSSLSRIGRVEGGANTVVSALIEAVAPGGTALFPAHHGHPGISPENPPVFDVRTTPTLSIGAIPEAARLRPGAQRSLEPTHSVTAFGARAAWFLNGHELCETPCGPGSPYDRLCEAGGKILLLGCDQESNTSLHMIEELFPVPYHMLPGVGIMRVTGYDGVERQLPMRFHRWGVPRCFMRIDPELTRESIQRTGLVGAAHCRLIDAAGMRNYVLARLREDPYLLLPIGYHLPPELDY